VWRVIMLDTVRVRPLNQINIDGPEGITAVTRPPHPPSLKKDLETLGFVKDAAPQDI
jgi:hypothetical protein